jgi:DNA mismatch repair protein MutS2
VGVFDHIFADIGDEQSIEQNLSTFSGHLTNIIHILREMTPNSLILLDELGAGTDPAEGSALAMAILEHMLQSGCRLIATTHYSELKAYAYEREGVINASMEFDIATLSPTYRLLIGVPGRSNAFAIAERLGLPRNIIEQARSRVNEENKKVESMIASLETNRATAEAERAEAERLRREIESLRDELAEQKKSFAKQKEKLLAKAEQEARELVRKARAEAEEIVRELRKMALEEKASLKEHKLIAVKGKLNEVERQIAQTDNNSSPPHRKIRVNPGDAVFVKHVGQKGHVVEKVNDDEVIVQLGILKMKVRTAELEPIEQKSGPPPVSFAAVRRPVDAPVRNELDLRGVTAEEALIRTEKFLDEAILSNLGQVYIIHGKGTGALRSVIHEFLKNHKQVKRFRLGEMGEGGSGVTVAEL